MDPSPKDKAIMENLTANEKNQVRIALLEKANMLRQLASGRYDPQEAERLRTEANYYSTLATRFD